MSSENVHETLHPMPSTTLLSPNVDVSNDICELLRVPFEVLEMIIGFVNGRDLNSLSETCRTMYTLLNDNKFWIHRIHCEFSTTVAELYTRDLFQKSTTIPSHDDVRQPGFAHKLADDQLDQLAIESATHYNDESIEKRRAKMYVSEEDFPNDVEFFQFKKTTNNCSTVPTMKVVYFYLIDRKRLAAVDMDIVHLDQDYLIKENDEDSLTGRIIRLRRVCWLQFTSRFEHKIMPGKYEVSWRMKCDLNWMSIWGETEFIVVPQHGRLVDFRMPLRSWEDLKLQHGNCWFTVKMGHIVIYEPSHVLVAIRNWNSVSWKYGLSWDCIELTLVP